MLSWLKRFLPWNANPEDLRTWAQPPPSGVKTLRRMSGAEGTALPGLLLPSPYRLSFSLVLATRCVSRACGTMGVVRPTVLIVDDHEVFRASARALLQAGGFDVIGEAAGGMEAIEAVSTLRPEVVVLDIQLPDLDGLAVAERLAAAPDPPAVVLISGREAATYGPRLRQTSARGFISKSELSGKVLAAMIGLSVRCSAGS
jgi:CheY-like chemotaxis protein